MMTMLKVNDGGRKTVRSEGVNGRRWPGGGPGRWRRRLWFCLLLLTLAGWGPGAGPALASLAGQVNINTAGMAELQELPFIGEVRARAIVELRREQGPFTELEELLASPAIGPRTLEAIRPYLALSGPSTLDRAAAADEKAADGSGVLSEPPPVGADGRPGASEAVEAADETAAPEAPAMAETFSLRRVIITRPGEIQVLCDQEYYPALLHLLQGATRRVELAMFVFRATEAAGNRPARIAEELINAGRRGVEVKVILEHSAYDEELTQEHRRLARNLRQGGVEVHFGPRDTTTHNKIILIDERFTLLGSHNLTHSALSRNHECSLLIDSRELVARLSAYLSQLPAR